MRVGIIGCGKIFPMHAYSLRELNEVELVAIADINEEKLRYWKRELDVETYVDYKEMIKKERLDAIHICTPHNLHKEMTIYALEHGLHVYTEKPSSITLKDSIEMLEVKKRVDKALVVSFQNRFNQSTLFVKTEFEKGKLGNFISAKGILNWSRSNEYYLKSGWKGTWNREGGGLIIDQAIHTIDIVPWILGMNMKVSKVFMDNWYHNSIEVEDIANISFEFSEGQKFTFAGNNFYSEDAPIQLQLIFEKGKATFTGDSVEIQYHTGITIAVHPEDSPLFDFAGHKQYWGTSHLKAIANFYREILLGNTNPKNSIEECILTQKLIDIIYSMSEFSNEKRK
ncbi:Gfo/Idh/MocA family protein [Enterococcus massiliensis]|uniref:Gfo/Idh/MocA family protein n=1 Tax=Enterococcus massiliensis TaxID=1640685 RepID=UPI00065E0256|nr:Gfo/Idh/MocA family oxidoreductase [Enterococcus massiliensis]